jgi:hypothetical protein
MAPDTCAVSSRSSASKSTRFCRSRLNGTPKWWLMGHGRKLARGALIFSVTSRATVSGSAQQPFRVPQAPFLARCAPPSTPSGLHLFGGSYAPAYRSAATPVLAPTFATHSQSCVLEQQFPPPVERAWRQPLFLADFRDRDLLNQMSEQQLGFVVCAPVSAFFLQRLAPNTHFGETIGALEPIPPFSR